MAKDEFFDKWVNNGFLAVLDGASRVPKWWMEGEKIQCKARFWKFWTENDKCTKWSFWANERTKVCMLSKCVWWFQNDGMVVKHNSRAQFIMKFGLFLERMSFEQMIEPKFFAVKWLPLVQNDERVVKIVMQGLGSLELWTGFLKCQKQGHFLEWVSAVIFGCYC